jgi:nicotinamidase-related amidase
MMRTGPRWLLPRAALPPAGSGARPRVPPPAVPVHHHVPVATHHRLQTASKQLCHSLAQSGRWERLGQDVARSLLQGVRLKSSASSSLDSQAAGPLFREWVSLAGTTALEGITSGATAITKDDALVVIDMQRDFVPASMNNPDGGRFGVAEGQDVVAPICSMIKAASDVGAVILASRDYHPNDHCSFSSYGGHFPSHCVAGTSGAQFLPEISEALESAMEKNGPDRVLIAFKGMHEHVDSFGALPYAREPFGDGRVPKAANAEPEGAGLGNFTKFGAIMGCTQAPWTGSLVLKQSAIAAAADPNDNREDDKMYDSNAPPDVLAVLQDGVDRKLRNMQDAIAANICPKKGKIFVCGLALDFCVHDTCVNAVALGMERVFIVADAARAAHVPGVGAHGSGFLTDPAFVRSSLASNGVNVVSYWGVLPEGYTVPRVYSPPGLSFPGALGPIGLKTGSNLKVESSTRVSLFSVGVIQYIYYAFICLYLLWLYLVLVLSQCLFLLLNSKPLLQLVCEKKNEESQGRIEQVHVGICAKSSLWRSLHAAAERGPPTSGGSAKLHEFRCCFACHAPLYICVFICIYVCVCVCVCMCVYVCVLTLN